MFSIRQPQKHNNAAIFTDFPSLTAHFQDPAGLHSLKHVTADTRCPVWDRWASGIDTLVIGAEAKAQRSGGPAAPWAPGPSHVWKSMEFTLKQVDVKRGKGDCAHVEVNTLTVWKFQSKVW